jgi:hypothetical protein
MRRDANRFGLKNARHVAYIRIAALSVAVWLLSGAALAADVNVDCSNAKAKVKTITAALAQLVKTSRILFTSPAPVPNGFGSPASRI